jgi:hypothetical protein
MSGKQVRHARRIGDRKRSDAPGANMRRHSRREQRDRLKILQRIVRELLVRMRSHDEVAALAYGDGVSVARCTRSEFESELTGSTGTVIDDHLLTIALLEFFAYEPPEYVGGVPGGKWYDHANRFGRILLGNCCRGERQQAAHTERANGRSHITSANRRGYCDMPV